jgi:hypothetical protein
MTTKSNKSTVMIKPSSNSPKGKSSVQFPNIIISDGNNMSNSSGIVAHFPQNILSIRDSLNLNSVYLGERDSFLKTTDSFDNSTPRVIIENTNTGNESTNGNDHGKGMKISFIVPKLLTTATVAVSSNKSPRNTGPNPLRPNSPTMKNTRPRSGSRGHFYFAFFGVINDFCLPKTTRRVEVNVPPTAKPIVLSTRPLSAKSPKSRNVKSLNKSSAQAYIDPLTQTKTYVREESRDLLLERDRSLKELLADALEDYYVRNGYPQSLDEHNKDASTQPIEPNSMRTKPNLTTVQVSSAPDKWGLNKEQKKTDFEGELNLPVEEMKHGLSLPVSSDNKQRQKIQVSECYVLDLSLSVNLSLF